MQRFVKLASLVTFGISIMLDALICKKLEFAVKIETINLRISIMQVRLETNYLNDSCIPIAG